MFGGIAGVTLAKWTPKHGKFRDPDEAAIETAVAECRTPLAKAPGDLEEVREGLARLMWDDAGIFRDAASLKRALAGLDDLDKTLDGVGVEARDLAYNLAWHDWLNLKNLILVSKVIAAAALARDDSRGAHWRADFPETGDLATSAFTSARLVVGKIDVAMRPVKFTRVRPGETLIKDTAAE